MRKAEITSGSHFSIRAWANLHPLLIAEINRSANDYVCVYPLQAIKEVIRGQSSSWTLSRCGAACNRTKPPETPLLKRQQQLP